jgi:hypothetical protein
VGYVERASEGATIGDCRHRNLTTPGYGSSHGAATPISHTGVRMIWLLSAIAIATIVIAGRAHGQRLDELDDQQCARLSEQVLALRLMPPDLCKPPLERLFLF